MNRKTAATVMLGILCVLAGYMARQPYNDTHGENTHAANQTPIGPTSKTPQGTNNSSNQPSQDPPPWYTSPEWALVAVGIVTFGVVGWQAWETRKSADAAKISASATEHSVQLQEALNRQWIDVEEVEHEWVTRFDPALSQSINLKFSFVNNTKMPLKIRSTPIPTWTQSALRKRIRANTRKNPPN